MPPPPPKHVGHGWVGTGGALALRPMDPESPFSPTRRAKMLIQQAEAQREAEQKKRKANADSRACPGGWAPRRRGPGGAWAGFAMIRSVNFPRPQHF